MDHIFLKARAKINLALDIVGRREDGYHDLRTVMQTINLYDTLFIKKTGREGIFINTNVSYLPTNEKNIVYKASEYMINKYCLKSGLYIDLQKAVPISAGLAGGSADCAAAILGIKKLFGLSIKYNELLKIGLGLGSDVPFCMARGTFLAEGRGEVLTKLPPHPKVYIVLAKPQNAVSTATIFKMYDSGAVNERPDIKQLIKHIFARDLMGMADNFCNVLEPVTGHELPVIFDLKEALLKNNALNALMSGSGPTVFGYFDYKHDALAAVRYLHKNFKQVKDIFLTTVFNPRKRGGSNARKFYS